MNPARSMPSRPKSGFSEAYYRRWYLDPATRIRSRAAHARQADFVFGYLGYLDIPVRRVLDLGCGLGHWRGEAARLRPRATYTGVELSPWICAKYGWEEGSAADYRGRGRYDLIVCQSVLQYLSDADAKRAIANMARLCRGAAYIEVVTSEDWREHCDKRFTDGNIHLRPGSWYRRALAARFRSAGGGIFIPKDSPAVLYELEKG